MEWNEKDHPRNKDGEFVEKIKSYNDMSIDELKKETSIYLNDKSLWRTVEPVEIDLKNEVQKKIEGLSPNERQKYVFQYILDNLRGEYSTKDGTLVSIDRVGADKTTHTRNKEKLKALVQLNELIEKSELLGIKKVEHKKFNKFAYYKTSFKIGNDIYFGLLNIGERKDGTYTVYDLNPFEKQ